MSQHYSDALDEVSLPSERSGTKPKQRSMLPQPGTPKSIVRPVALSDGSTDSGNNASSGKIADGAPKVVASTSLTRGTAVTGSRLGRLRPRSTYHPDSAPISKDIEARKPAAAQSIRPPGLLGKPSVAPSSSLARTQSLRRPAVTSQHAPSVPVAGHSRTQSTSIVPLARSNTTKPRTTGERPKSLHISSGNSTYGMSDAAQPDPAIARTSTRLTGLSRSASVKTRSDGTGGVMRPPAATKPTEPALTQTKIKEVAKEEPRKAARPAFSTLQQHFTPRKTGKAPTSTFLHPAPATTSSNLPPEIVGLQMELLQLHLLHGNAAEVSRQWGMSAKRALRSKFDEVSGMYKVMLQHERSGQEQKNLQALIEWTKEKPSASLVEYIHILSGPLHDLPSLVQTGGRFQRHSSAFEKWLIWVEEIQAARQDRIEAGIGSIEGLGDAWQAENAALVRKLTSFARDLSSLPQPAAGSSIMTIVTCCRALLNGLLEELRVMHTIEADIVSHEKDWVESRLQGIAADIGSFIVDETPAWRM